MYEMTLLLPLSQSNCGRSFWVSLTPEETIGASVSLVGNNLFLSLLQSRVIEWLRIDGEDPEVRMVVEGLDTAISLECFFITVEVGNSWLTVTLQTEDEESYDEVLDIIDDW